MLDQSSLKLLEGFFERREFSGQPLAQRARTLRYDRTRDASVGGRVLHSFHVMARIRDEGAFDIAENLGLYFVK
jgi:hypothetical protein